LWVALDSGMRDVQLIAIPAVHRTYPLYHEHRQGPTDIGHLLSRWQVKVWSITSRSPIFTFDVHEERRRKLYRIPPQIHVNRTSSLQETTKRFGFGTIFPNRASTPSKASYTANVSFTVSLGGGVPVIVSGSEDGMIKIWNASTYRLETPSTMDWNAHGVSL